MPVTKKESSKLIKLSEDVPVAPQQKDKDVGNQSTFLAQNQNCEPLVTDSLSSENDKNSSTQSSFADGDGSGPLLSVITHVSDDSLSSMAEKDNGREEALVVSEFVQNQQDILCEMELKQFKQEVVTVEPSISFDSANSLSSTTNLPSIDRESRISESMEVSDSVRSSLEKEPSQDAVSVISYLVEAYDGGGSFVQTCPSTSSNTVFVGLSRTSESSVDRCGTSEPGGEHERSSGGERTCDEELVTEFYEKKALVLSSTVNSHFASPEEGESNISAIMGTAVSTNPTSTFSDSKCAELVPSEQGPIDYFNGGTYTDGLPFKNAEHDSLKKVSRAVPSMVLAAQLTASAPGGEYASFLQFGSITPGMVKAVQVDSVEVSDFLRSSLEKEPSQDVASGISDPVEESDGGGSFVHTCQLQASFLQFGTITPGIVKAMQARRDSLRAVSALPTLFAPKPLLLHPLPQQKQALVLSGRIIDTSSGPWGTELKPSLEQVDSVEVSDLLRSSLEKEPSQDAASEIFDPVEASNSGGSFVQTCQLQASTSSNTVFVGVSRTSESYVDRCDTSEPGGEHERSSGGERSSDEESVTEFSEKKAFVLNSTDISHFASPEEGESNISAIMGTAVSTNPTSSFSDSKCAELVPSEQGSIDYFNGGELFDPTLNKCEILCSEGTAAREPCILPLEMTATPSISSEIKPEINYVELCDGAQTPVLSRSLIELNGSKKNKKNCEDQSKAEGENCEVAANASLPSNASGPSCGTELKQSLQQVDSVEVSDFLRSSLEKEPSQDAASGISDLVETSDGGGSFVQTCQLQASFLQFGTITPGIVKAMQVRRDSLRAVPALPTLFAPKPLLLHPLPQQKQALVRSGRIIDTSSGPWGTELKQFLEQVDSVEVSDFLRYSLEKEPSQDGASGISDPVEASNGGGSFVQTCQLQASTSSNTVFVGVSRTSESSVDRCDTSEPGGEHERSCGGERSSDEELVTEFSEKKAFVLSSTDNSHFASPEEGESNISAIMGAAVSTNPTSTFSDNKCVELVPSDQGPIDYFNGSEVFDPVLNTCEILCSEGTAARQPCILPLERTTTLSISSEIKPEINYADLCVGAQTPVLSRVLLELNGSKKNKKKKINKKKKKAVR